MTVRDYLTQSLENLSDTELQEVAEYVTFLKFRARGLFTPEAKAAEVGALYAEFGQEDQLLAEAGMGEYYAGLLAEDEQ